MNTIFPKQAMVLAAGFGKRMGMLTDTLPKPMIEVAGRTLIDRAIDNLEAAGIEKVVVNTSYKASVLEEHLKKRKTSHITFSREEEPLETGGGIAKALHHFGNAPFFSVNGDVIWFDTKKPALRNLFDAWNDELDALLLLNPVETAMGYEGKGDFFLDNSGHLTRRGDKPSAPYIYTGIQILHPRLFTGCPEGAFSLNILYNKAINATPPRIKAIVHEGILLHVGDPAGKKLAEDYIENLDRMALNG